VLGDKLLQIMVKHITRSPSLNKTFTYLLSQNLKPALCTL